MCFGIYYEYNIIIYLNIIYTQIYYVSQSKSSLKQSRSQIVYWMWLVVVSNIISYKIQFQATFYITHNLQRESTLWIECGSVTIETNPYNAHRTNIEMLRSETTLWLKYDFYNAHNPDYLLLWLHSGLCGLCELFEP